MSGHWAIALRNGMAVIMAGLILVGPAYRQVLGGEQVWMPKWTMFSGMALNFYGLGLQYRLDEAEPWQAVPTDLINISKVNLDSHGRPLPATAVRLRKLREVEGLLRHVCKELEPKAQLLVNVRMADRRRGWTSVMAQEVRPCSAQPQRRGER